MTPNRPADTANERPSWNHLTPEQRQGYLLGYQHALSKAASILVFDHPAAYQALVQETQCHNCAALRPVQLLTPSHARQRAMLLCEECRQEELTRRQNDPDQEQNPRLL